MTKLRIKVKIVRDGGRLPVAATSGSSGVDLHAAIKEPLIIEPGGFSTIPTGIAVEIPYGFEGQVRGRSGLASKHGIGVLNAPGTIDSDYRGEIMVVLFNFGRSPFVVEPGMRIAQLVFAPVVSVEFLQVENLSETARGERGFGGSDTGIP